MTKESKTYSVPLEFSNVRDRGNTLNLRVGCYPAKSAESKCGLVLCNGRTEWIEKYSHVAEDLKISPSTAFITWDHRGQGASGGARAWIDDYKTYSQDMANVIASTLKDKPYNLICHSMGGLIALHGIVHGYFKPRCVVLSSPLLGMPAHPIPPRIARTLSSALTLFGFGHVNSGGGRHSKPPFEENILTHSAERFQTIQSTPYPVRSATFEWVKASFEAIQTVRDPTLLRNLTMPILVMCGSDEKVVDLDAIKTWVDLAKKHANSKIDLQIIPGGRHELLFESRPYYDLAISAINQWFHKVGCPI
ncbi:MAG: alpha/beta hydrolase [Proteobacteria bacterium]|nr:alpha/beta hydrolase [Pseudomonadota bacterium]